MYERNDNLDTVGSAFVALATAAQVRLVEALYGNPSDGFDPENGYNFRYAFRRTGSHPVTFYDSEGQYRVGSVYPQGGVAFLAWLDTLLAAMFVTKSPEGEIWSGDAADLAESSPEYADLVRTCEPGQIVTTITGFKVYRPSR